MTTVKVAPGDSKANLTSGLLGAIFAIFVPIFSTLIALFACLALIRCCFEAWQRSRVDAAGNGQAGRPHAQHHMFHGKHQQRPPMQVRWPPTVTMTSHARHDHHSNNPTGLYAAYNGTPGHTSSHWRPWHQPSYAHFDNSPTSDVSSGFTHPSNTLPTPNQPRMETRRSTYGSVCTTTPTVQPIYSHTIYVQPATAPIIGPGPIKWP